VAKQSKLQLRRRQPSIDVNNNNNNYYYYYYTPTTTTKQKAHAVCRQSSSPLHVTTY